MADLRDVVAYICEKYPHKHELSKARLTKLVYLADWRSAITRGQQLTNISWQFNHYGPYVDDVVQVARNEAAFEVRQDVTMYGDAKEVIRITEHIPCDSLVNEDREILNYVIRTTEGKYWDSFVRLVYSTYPIVTQPRFISLDLVSLAAKYQEELELLTE